MSVFQLVLPLVLLGQTTDNETSLEAMQKRVEPTRISLTNGEGRKDSETKARLVEKPVFRYSDELRQIEDAGIWLWTDRNRPVAAMKEVYTPFHAPIEFRWSVAIEEAPGGAELHHRLRGVAFPHGPVGSFLRNAYARVESSMQASMHRGLERLASLIEARPV